MSPTHRDWWAFNFVLTFLRTNQVCWLFHTETKWDYNFYSDTSICSTRTFWDLHKTTISGRLHVCGVCVKRHESVHAQLRKVPSVSSQTWVHETSLSQIFWIYTFNILIIFLCYEITAVYIVWRYIDFKILLDFHLHMEKT